MRAGWVVSAIGHVGFVILTMLAWEVGTPLRGGGTAIVPVEIVDVAVEANVRALAEEVEDPDQEDVANPEDEARQETPPPPAPTPTPTPPRRPTPADEFDPGRAADLAGQARTRQQEGESSDTNQTGQGRGDGETTTLEARIAAISRQELNRCWRSTADMPEPERLVVILAVRLNRDGSLNGQPRVIQPAGNTTFDPLMTEAVNRALRAVRTCEPIERLPADPIVGEHFDLWREQEVRFGPRQN
jgi:type IV secretory pathway VirB10-like protein